MKSLNLLLSLFWCTSLYSAKKWGGGNCLPPFTYATHLQDISLYIDIKANSFQNVAKNMLKISFYQDFYFISIFQVCSECLRNVTSEAKCSLCDLPICNDQCQMGHNHYVECQILRNFRNDIKGN